MTEHGDRRRRFLPTNSEVKQDLQEIFASTEATYLNIRDILSITNDMEKAIEKLQTMLASYTQTSSDNMEDGDDKLNQIIEFCSSISDSFEKLVETLSTESEMQQEETKKNRTILSNVAATYKTIYNQLISIKASLDEAMSDRKKIDSTIREVTAKIDLIYVALQTHAPLVLFFKNMKDEEVLRLLPTLQIVIAEILKEKGYSSTGEKKDPIIIFTNLIFTQVRNNLVSIIAALIMIWLVNGWVAATNKSIVTSTPQKQELEDMRMRVGTMEEVNKKLQAELQQKKK